MRIDWDLSDKHTRKQVIWPSEDLASTSVDPVESVRIRLPEDQVLRMPDRVQKIIMHRKANGPDPAPGPRGEVITYLQVDSKPLSVQDAYRRALAYAEQFDLPREPLEGWRERRDRGVDGLTDRTATTLDRPLGGNSGPVPYLELRYSTTEGRPWRVSMQFFWPE